MSPNRRTGKADTGRACARHATVLPLDHSGGIWQFYLQLEIIYLYLLSPSHPSLLTLRSLTREWEDTQVECKVTHKASETKHTHICVMAMHMHRTGSDQVDGCMCGTLDMFWCPDHISACCASLPTSPAPPTCTSTHSSTPCWHTPPPPTCVHTCVLPHTRVQPLYTHTYVHNCTGISYLLCIQTVCPSS